MPDLSVSVITINRNTGDTVRRTIASIHSQTYPCEWVVVDGASNDESIDVLRQSIRAGDRLISEPDRGISDAFNKGLHLATGEAVIFMNAGDEFAAPDALANLVAAWDRTRHSWITGTAMVVRGDGQVIYRRPNRQPADPRVLIRNGCRVFHQATLADRRLLIGIGGFDLTYRLVMDYDLWCRLLQAGHVPQVVDVTVCRYGIGGVSGNAIRRVAEERRARAAHGLANPPWRDCWLAAVARLKAVLRGRVGNWAYRLKERLGW